MTKPSCHDQQLRWTFLLQVVSLVWMLSDHFLSWRASSIEYVGVGLILCLTLLILSSVIKNGTTRQRMFAMLFGVINVVMILALFVIVTAILLR